MTTRGKLVVSEEIVTCSTVPEPVKQAVEQKYPGGKVTLAKKLTLSDAVQYELRIKYKGKELEALFDPEGREVDQYGLLRTYL
jgi:hypothetical protein